MKRVSLLLVVFVLACTSLVACNKSTQNNQQANSSDYKKIRTQQTANEKLEIKNKEAVSTRLKNLAERIPGVKGANVVVFGNTAIVGIDVEGNLDRSRVGTLKYTVAEALRKDPHGANAVVTADIDINARLQEIGEDIRNGQPLAGFINELGDIVGRIMPQLPTDLLPREEHTPPESVEKKPK